MEQQISARDNRLGKMVLALCLYYLFCNLPMIPVLLPGGSELPWLYMVSRIILHTQFSMNIVIYALSNKQYRYCRRILNFIRMMDLSPGRLSSSSLKKHSSKNFGML